ncbi:glycosyl hydrolase [Streptomyces sp. NPDC049954]|uniref:glycosyl hydrolase n=1 Tax=Streptomyces sp. NPDC049954 TaxID=3155779 RepID=UPI00342A76D1
MCPGAIPLTSRAPEGSSRATPTPNGTTDRHRNLGRAAGRDGRTAAGGPAPAAPAPLAATLTADTKPAALSEVGPVPDPALMRAYRADWSWFLTWGGDFLTDGKTNPVALLRTVYEDPHVITLDRLGDFKHHG